MAYFTLYDVLLHTDKICPHRCASRSGDCGSVQLLIAIKYNKVASQIEQCINDPKDSRYH
eukprot:10022059-Ditylum_brightwellii.AAC.1